MQQDEYEDKFKWVQPWIEWRELGLEIRPWSEDTKRNQVQYLTRFLSRLMEKESLSEALANCLKEVPTTQQTKRRHIQSSVSSYARFLNTIGQLSYDELNQIKGLYPQKSCYYQPTQNLIYDEELQKVLELLEIDTNIRKRIFHQTIMILLSETALRVSELCALSGSDLHFSDDPKIAHIQVKRGKGGKARKVPFSKKAQSIVREYLNLKEGELPCSPLLWVPYKNSKWTPLQRDSLLRHIKEISDRVGTKFTAHSLRHYRITKWANDSRIPISITKKWAGHSSLVVTERYIHIRDEDALKAAFE